MVYYTGHRPPRRSTTVAVHESVRVRPGLCLRLGRNQRARAQERFSNSRLLGLSQRFFVVRDRSGTGFKALPVDRSTPPPANGSSAPVLELSTTTGAGIAGFVAWLEMASGLLRERLHPIALGAP